MTGLGDGTDVMYGGWGRIRDACTVDIWTSGGLADGIRERNFRQKYRVTEKNVLSFPRLQLSNHLSDSFKLIILV